MKHRIIRTFGIILAAAIVLVCTGTAQTACNVVYTISPQNTSAFGAAITIQNTGTTALSSWTLTWTFANGQTVSQLWNGIETQSGANVTVKNEPYNGSIPAGGSVTGIGFNGTWNGATNAVPASFAINGTTCGSGGGGSGSFTLAPASSAVTLTQGTSATDAISVTDVNGFSGAVTLSATSSNSGVGVTVSGNTLTLSASSTASGTATISVTGTSGSTTATTSITVTVKAATTGSFTLTPASSAVTLTQGTSATDAITVTDVNGFSGAVTLSATSSNSGVTVAVSGDTLTLSASSSASGTATISVTGTSGSTTATTSITVTVKAATTGSFTLAPASSAVTLTQGTSTTDAITVTDVNGFSGAVTLSATSSNSGVGVTVSGDTLTLSASSSASGTATISVTGTSGSTTATTSITVTVKSSGTGSGACNVVYTISPQNTTAFGAAITIQNTSTTALSNWTLTWSFANGQTVSSLWNGIETQSGANVTVTNEPYNGSIPAGGSATGIGFNGTWNGATNAVPTNFAINGTACGGSGGGGSGSFTLTPASSAVTLTQGTSTTDAISVTDVNGFSGAVTLSATSSNSGVGVTVSGDTLTLSASSTASGTATISVTGTSGSTTATTSITVTVKAATTGSFTLTPASSAVTLTQGTSATDAISVTDVNGFSGAVTLSATSSNSGVGVTVSGDTLTLSASSTASGTATISVTGTSGSTTATTSITVTVNTSGGQSSCSPTGVIALDGGAYEFQMNEYDSTLQECATVSGTGFTITTANFNNTTSGSPATYTSIYSGCHWGVCTSSDPFPIEENNIASATSSVSITQPSGYTDDASYDIWFNQTSTTTGQPNGTEIMIWLNHQGSVQPFGTNTGNVTIDGASWAVWTGNQTSWKIVSYVANTPVTSATNLNLLPFFSDAVSRGSLESTWWLIDVEYGFEIWTGGQGLAMSNFSVTATSGGNSSGSFTLTPASSAVTLTQGTSTTDAISVTDVNGFSGAVTLSATSSNSGVGVTVSGDTLTLSASSTASGTATISVTGTSGSTTATTSITVTVKAATTGSFTLTPASSAVTLTQGTSATDAITVTDVNGFSGAVTLSATSSNSGVTVAVSGDTLTLSASSSASGTATISVTGTSGSTTATTAITVTITGTSGYTTFQQHFVDLYNDIHTSSNGYFGTATSGDQIPYHSVETLMGEAPDYGHETSSETYSYWIWLETLYGGLTKNWTGLQTAWTSMEDNMIPSSTLQPTNAGYNASSPATYAPEHPLPSAYPSTLTSSVSVGNDPLASQLSSTWGNSNMYSMHWIIDTDNWYGFGQEEDGVTKPSCVNTFQRGANESVWLTVPQPCWDALKYGSASNGYLDLFTAPSPYTAQWKYTDAPDADARAVQVMYWAEQYANAQGGSSVVTSLLPKAAKLGDYLRYAMFDKYFKAIGCTGSSASATSCPAGSGYSSSHYLLGWYFAWGGALPSSGSWAWRIGDGTAHFGYQNPVAAYALSKDAGISGKLPTQSVTDWSTSLERQLELYRWLQSDEGAIAGGATNSWEGSYSPTPTGDSTFYNMAYDWEPVYHNPPSNQWFGMQVWSMERLAEYYYISGDSKAAIVLNSWIPWVEKVTTVNSDGTFTLPGSLCWDNSPGQGDTTNPWNDSTCGLVASSTTNKPATNWNASTQDWTTVPLNPNLHVRVTGTATDIGEAGSLAKALSYYSAAVGKWGSSGTPDATSEALAKSLLTGIWTNYRDSIGISVAETRGDYCTSTTSSSTEGGTTLNGGFGATVYVPSDWVPGTMPAGEDVTVSPQPTFLSLRPKYKEDPSYPLVESGCAGAGAGPTFNYHRFWAQVDMASAYFVYAYLFPGN